MSKKFFYVGALLYINTICPFNILAEKVYTWTDNKTHVTVNMENGTLLLIPQNENAIRVKYMRGNVDILPEYIYVENKQNVVKYKSQESANNIVVSVDDLKVILDKNHGFLTFKDSKDKVVLKEKLDGRMIYSVDLGREKAFFIEQKFESPKDEYIYGTGQFQDGYLNIRGLPRKLTQLNTQISIPFVLSSKGYGLLWHNYGLTYFNPVDNKVVLKKDNISVDSQIVSVTTTEGAKNEVRNLNLFTGSFNVNKSGKYALLLDVGSTMARKHNLKIDGKQIVEVNNLWLPSTTSLIVDLEAGQHDVVVESEANDKPELFFEEVKDETVFRSPVSDCLDYTVFGGYGDDVISSYRSLSGNAPMMPKWALGYIHCRERFKSQDELLSVAKEFRERKLPVDLIVQDWQYWGKYGWNAMRFDEDSYPDPKGMVDKLHDMDMRLMLSVWSRVNRDSEVGKELSSKDYYIRNTDWVDFFNPDAAACYWKNFSNNLVPIGIDAWWQDATEPENDDLHGRMVGNNSISGERVRNIYPLMVCKTVYEGLRDVNPNKRTMILTRSGFSGLQRYAAAVWSGDVGNDWETLRRQIASGLNYNASGLPWWTYDAGGFFRPGDGQYTDKDFHERFLRWFQIATFLPLQRVHGFQTDTEFWRYGKDVVKIAEKSLNLRYRLLPYIYSEAAAITFKGSTMMRPFVMDYPDDTMALNQKYDYMFGPSILVSPVVEPGIKSKKVYLPFVDGGWYDFWTGINIKGGSMIDTKVELDYIPLYVKAGSILPMGALAQHTNDKTDAPLEIRVYPGANGSYTLYDDEGDNYNYEKGKYSTILLEWNDEKQELTLNARDGNFDGMLQKRVMKIVKVKKGKGCGIGSNGSAKQIVYDGDKMILKL